MTLIKRDYIDNETLITAKNLNDIQDAVIALEDGLFTAENSASGMAITLTDASKRGFTSFSIYGKTTQNGTPTPDNPIDLVNIGKGNITVNVMGEKGSQSMTIATPNGLPGIPVPTGGNYTDANGQQWICDEIDLARGVYVKRIGKSIVDGVSNPASKNDESELSHLYYSRVADKAQGDNGICTHFSHFVGYPSGAHHVGNFNVTMATGIVFFSGYGIVSGDNSTMSSANEFNNWLKAQNEAGTPVTLLYVLDTPKETPLSAEEIAAFATLHGYKNYTQVTNDAGAWMELEYIMDAKKYIDQIMATK